MNIVCILVPYAFWFLLKIQNIVEYIVKYSKETLISMWIPKDTALIWGPVIISGNAVFTTLFRR